MFRVLIGIVIGIYLATAGVSGLLNMADKGVETVKEMSKEVSK